MDSIKSQLKAMGFGESKISKAIESNPEAQTLEQIMEWLIAHEDELNADGPSTSKSSTSKTNLNPKNDSMGGAQAPSASTMTISPRVDDFNPSETAVETAARKKITVEEAQRLITERQAIRAEEERKKEIDDEKKRRQEGQKLIQTRAELEDQERIRLAQQIRREKLEKEAHKKKILEQIALDRENMKTRAKPIESSPSNCASKSVPKSTGTECRLALRFPDGTSKVQTFSPQEQLAAVRLFVQMEKPLTQGGTIEFVAPPNKKLTENDMQDTLEGLGLCPASRLEVKFIRSEIIDLD